MKAVKHILLNRASSRCEESEDYRFGDCLHQKVAGEIGCQTFWTKFPGIPTCGTQSQLLQYHLHYAQLVQLEKRVLMATTGCLDPCRYIEYRVRHSSNKIFSFSTRVSSWPLTQSYLTPRRQRQT